MKLQYLDIIGSRKFISRVSKGEAIEIDFEPRLVIFGYDPDQRGGKIWKFHIDKIKSKIGKRLIFKRSTDSFENL